MVNIELIIQTTIGIIELIAIKSEYINGTIK